MKQLPVLILWSSLLVFTLWVSQSVTEGCSSDVCEVYSEELQVHMQDFTGQDQYVDRTDVQETFICLLYPTNTLNCSWSFHTVEKDTQLSVYISVCNDDEAVELQNNMTVDRVGSMSLTVSEYDVSYVVLHFNMTLHEKWTAYTYVYRRAVLALLSPPPNFTAAMKDGGLHVTWDQPSSDTVSAPNCFEYQLDMGDQVQERTKNLTGERSYIEPNADPTNTYSMRIRTRIEGNCKGPLHWSAWSPTVTVEQSTSLTDYQLNPLVIASISLGLPMILLAVLLLLCHQRVWKALFPPIPQPPPEYKYFMEKNEAFSFFHPAPSPKPEEEITEVEDAEQNPGETF